MKLCLLPGFRYHVTSDFCLPIVSYTKNFHPVSFMEFQVLPVISRRSRELAFHLLSFGRLYSYLILHSAEYIALTSEGSPNRLNGSKPKEKKLWSILHGALIFEIFVGTKMPKAAVKGIPSNGWKIDWLMDGWKHIWIEAACEADTVVVIFCKTISRSDCPWSTTQVVSQLRILLTDWIIFTYEWFFSVVWGYPRQTKDAYDSHFDPVLFPGTFLLGFSICSKCRQSVISVTDNLTQQLSWTEEESVQLGRREWGVLIPSVRLHLDKPLASQTCVKRDAKGPIWSWLGKRHGRSW